MDIRQLCEFMTNPTGVDIPNPLLSWCAGEADARIEAARVTVLRRGTGELVWDSGFMENTDRCFYGGKPLLSGRAYSWRVELRTDKGVYSSDEAMFTMGLPKDAPWSAGWVGGIQIDAKSYMYRRELTVNRPIRAAAAFVASPNYNVFTVNGRRADDSVLNNVFADYDKSLYYATYDLTDIIQAGENAIGVMTGLGWRSLREAEDGIGWGDSLFSVQLVLEYEDGSEEWLLPDASGWRYTADSPVTYNSIYNGETYDARLEKQGWDAPGYDDGDWSRAVEKEPPAGVPRSQLLEPIRVVAEMSVREIIAAPDNSWTLDFGRNFAGWVRIRVSGSRGDRIGIKPAEQINADGSVNAVSLRNAHPVDTFILKGEGTEVWEPRFTYHGFRYAQIFGLAQKPSPDMFTGCVVRSDVEDIGSFRCGSAIVQGFYDIVKQTEASNLHGVPTDCPQRDERLGWLNDMTVRNEGALYSFRLYQLYAKWLRDIRDTQGRVTGAITDTAPFLRFGFRPADPVSASFLLLPWNLYLHYGDDRIIRENYDANARWVSYIARNSDDLIVRYSSMGDWAAPVEGTDHGSTGGGALSTITPRLLMSTGYLYYNCTLMAKMAAVLGREGDRADWLALAERVKRAFNLKYYNREGGYYASGSQAANIIPLYFGIVGKEEAPLVLKSLCDDIMIKHGGHLTTGNLCTRYAIEVLFRYGKQDIAWYLLNQTDYPSWGFMLANGATTVWERWEKVDDNDFLAAMAALNHPMNGGAVVGLFKYLAGIAPDEDAPGWKNIIFRPIIPKDAPSAEAVIHTARGTVASRWERADGAVKWDIEIPAGCTGSVYMPCREQPERVGEGKHSFTL